MQQGPFSAPQDRRSPRRPTRLDVLGVVLSRATTFAVLFWVTLRFEGQSLIRGLVLVYAFSTVLYLATWMGLYRLSRASPIGFLFYFQFLIEIGIIASIFLLSDGYYSEYGLLFILTILSSGLFFQYAGSLVTATLSAAAFAYAGAVHLGLASLPDLNLSPLTVEGVQVRFFLHATLFYMVALLSAQLSQRLKTVASELEGKHRELDLYQFSAESMMNDLPVGLLFFDEGGRLRYFNAPSPALLGRKVAPGMSFGDALGPDLLPPELSARILREKGAFRARNFETRVGDRILRIQIKPLCRQDICLGFIATVLDFTHEKSMERALLRSERMAALGEMSARIAHEIRNPLSSVSGSAQMLLGGDSDSRSEGRLLNLIINESVRLNRILTDLLNFSREKVPSYRRVSLASLFKKLKLVLEKNPSFHKELVSIAQFMENGDVEFFSDQDILFQVLLNVSINGLQAMEGIKGTLEHSARRTGSKIAIQVRDTGRGMGEEALKRAFEPFYTTKPEGTGLGLSTCLHDIQSLDGSIQLESSPERGTVVTITLPGDRQPTEIPNGN